MSMHFEKNDYAILRQHVDVRHIFMEIVSVRIKKIPVS